MKSRNKKSSSLFISDSGGLTPTSILFLIGLPVILSKQYKWGIAILVLGLLLAIKHAMENLNGDERIEIRYNILSAEDLIAELEQLEDRNNGDGHTTNNDDNDTIISISGEEIRIKYLEGLSALARKYNKSDRKNELAMQCQQIAFTTLRLYPDDDQVVAGSISLLALIAKDTRVRKRYKYQANDYGLNRPINALQKALERAKVETDETKEEFFAEILRKGCLFLGAVCNDDNELGLASIIVQEGGLELILEAGNWFRFHEELANWALWAIFTLCFDQIRIKMQLVGFQGIPIICELMKNNPTNLEVNRHGTALLFDLLRENQSNAGEGTWDPWEIRKIALASGLHDVVFSAMNEFSDSRDIMMMGQEILVGTGFRGNIPLYQQM